MVPFRAMRRPRGLAFWIAVLTVVLTVVLRPLAFTYPVDPTWIAGLYDGADLDDAVYFLATCSGVDTPGLEIPRPLARLSDPVLEGVGASAPAHGSLLTRAPPLPFAPPV
jgi:hypothetical protein